LLGEEYAKLLDDLLFVPAENWSSTRAEEFKKALLENPSVSPSALTESTILDDLSLTSLFEGEAALIVAQHLSNLPLSQEQYEIASDNDHLWSLVKVSGPYTRLIKLALPSLLNYFDIERGSKAAELHLVYHIISLMIDLASAYPTPDLLETSALAKYYYEPGIRFMWLLNTLLDFDTATSDAFISAIIRGPYEAEAVLLQYCKVPYPPSLDIYHSWQTLLSKISEEDDDRVAEMRKQACVARAEKPRLYQKELSTFFDAGLQINYINDTGIQSYYTNGPFFPSDDKFKELVVDILKESRDLSLVEAFVGRAQYVCPLASAQICEARAPDCLSGISNLGCLPGAGCSVRSSLENTGFILGHVGGS
jgi:hypothetical protein